MYVVVCGNVFYIETFFDQTYQMSDRCRVIARSSSYGNWTTPWWIHVKVSGPIPSRSSIIFPDHTPDFFVFTRQAAHLSPSHPPSSPLSSLRRLFSSLLPFSRYSFWSGKHTREAFSAYHVCLPLQPDSVTGSMIEWCKSPRCFFVYHLTRGGGGGEKRRRLGVEACEIGWFFFLKKRKRGGEKEEEEVESWWRVPQQYLGTRTLLVWLSGPLGFNPFDIAWVPSMCQGYERVAAVERKAEGERERERRPRSFV